MEEFRAANQKLGDDVGVKSLMQSKVDSVITLHALAMLTMMFYSSKSKVPVWPFLLLSCFGSAYALLPYFIFWNPPAPPTEEAELKSWPLIFLESKVTVVVSTHLSFILKIIAGRYLKFNQK
ncbi:hypothetical protein HN51_066246 [Arachis hypogaea]